MKNQVKAKAHGRVNLIGEHTDYNGGWVLPTSIPQFTQVELTRSSDQTVALISSAHHMQSKRQYSYLLGKEAPTDTWADYLEGATKILREKGYALSGLKAHIESNVPEGSGVSSSAALEMSFLMALNDMFEFNISPTDLALIGQRIENEFVGARVGIMDQMATSLAQDGEALFLDTLTLQYERIPLPENMDLMVINSGISHQLSANDGGYNQRRKECEEACQILGIKYLRDISPSELSKKDLPEILKKRARHVVTENERVHLAVKAIKENDLKTLGRLFIKSHESMKNDYQVSITEIDLLVDLCLKEKEVYGARLTGGGFGGSIVAIMKKGSKEKVSQNVIQAYKETTGLTGTLLV